MKKISLIVCLLGLMLATALGQNSQPTLQAKIPFEFWASGKTFAAGNYSFSVSNETIKMTNQDTGEAVFLQLMTRLAAEKSPASTAKISFDVQQDKHFIEALWPDSDDGYLLHAVKGEHTHKIVKAM